LERTIPEYIGLKINLDSLDALQVEFNRLAYFVSVNAKNVLKVDSKGLLAKYGFVDLTYETGIPGEFIRLFAKTE